MIPAGPRRVWIRTAANGFADVTTFSLWSHVRLGLLLHLRYGFWRWGAYVAPVADESIHPSFRRRRLRILAGWDSALGYYLLAGDARSDAFLRAFYARHCGSTRNEGGPEP